MEIMLQIMGFNRFNVYQVHPDVTVMIGQYIGSVNDVKRMIAKRFHLADDSEVRIIKPNYQGFY
jgi:hypothetical protein